MKMKYKTNNYSSHYVYFHKEVSFINWNSNQDKNVHYWILRKNNKISNIESFEKDNPIHTSYWLLWKELKENNSSIVIQNIMRRIIEHYFKNLWWYRDDDIIWTFLVIMKKKWFAKHYFPG